MGGSAAGEDIGEFWDKYGGSVIGRVTGAGAKWSSDSLGSAEEVAKEALEVVAEAPILPL